MTARAADVTTIENRRKRFTLLCYLGHAANDTYWFILPIVLPMILRQFGIRYSTAGAILTAYLAVIALLSFAIGRLSDVIPRWRIIGFGFLLANSIHQTPPGKTYS